MQIQFSRLAVALARVLQDNYPMRLHELYVLDLPPGAYWLFRAVLRCAHPDTRLKVKLCSSTDAQVRRLLC